MTQYTIYIIYEKKKKRNTSKNIVSADSISWTIRDGGSWLLKDPLA